MSHTHDGLTCEEFVAFIMDYVDKQLDPKVREEFDKHIGHCPPCVAYLKNYQSLVDASKNLREFPCEEPPEKLVNAILSSIRKQ